MSKNSQFVVTGEEMRRYDKNTTEVFHVPSLVLMEQAAMAAADFICKRMPDSTQPVLVLAGKGNNGGDAMAVARLLTQRGYQVTVCIVSEQEISRSSFSEQAGVQYDILQAMGVRLVTRLPVQSYPIVIDGIFGVGLSRPVGEKTAEIIRHVCTWEAKRIALDIPSGVNADNGAVIGCAFAADYTITFGFLKRGLCLYPGAQYAGQVVVKEIGIREDSFLDQPPLMHTWRGFPKELMPVRKPSGHKGSFGKVLVAAGSGTVGGAAYLAARAALLTGCGMVKLITHKNQQAVVGSLLPEALLGLYDTKEEAAEQVQQGIAWADVIVMGPGIGTDECAQALWEEVIRTGRKPLVLDADALNLLALEKNKELLFSLQDREETRRALVLTPHPLELRRVVGETRIGENTDRIALLQALARRYHAVVVGKDARTVTAEESGRLCLNLTGNSGMATAGSGDVLSGIIGALLAQSMEPYEASSAGVYLHGYAGDLAAAEKNPFSMVAGDICEALVRALQ